VSRFVNEVCLTSFPDIVLVRLASNSELFSDKCHIKTLLLQYQDVSETKVYVTVIHA